MRQLTSVLCCLSLLLCGTPVPGRAAITGAEELFFGDMPSLISTGFFKTSQRKAPGYSVVVSKDQLGNTSLRTLEDLLQFYVPGVHIGRQQANGTLIGTRGVLTDSNAKNLVLWDGQQTNMRNFFGHWSFYQTPLLGDMETVEVINGPGAIVHGSGAINGFINIIPKNGSDNPGFRSGVEYGTEEQSYKAESQYGRSYGDNKDVYVYLGAHHANGMAADHFRSEGKVFNRQALETGSPSFRLSSVWNHGGFNLNSFLNRSYAAENNKLGVYNYRSRYTYETFMGLRPKYVWKIDQSDSLDLLGSLYAAQFGTDYRTQDRSKTDGLFAPLPGFKSADKETALEAKAIYKTTRVDRHSLAAGLLLGRREFSSGNLIEPGVTVKNTEIHTQWVEWGAFGEDVIAITDPWTLSLGLRYDQVVYGNFNASPPPQKSVGQATGRVATAYEFNQDTVVKLSFQQGFRYDDAERVVDNAFTAENNRALGYSMKPLKPETLDSFELNFSRDVRPARLRFDLNAFYNTYHDLLAFGRVVEVPAGDPVAITDTYINTRHDFSSAGGELILSWVPRENLAMNISYEHSAPAAYSTSLNSELPLVTGSRSRWARHPNHAVKAHALASLLEKKLDLSVAALYNSRYNIRDMGNVDPDFGSGRLVVDVGSRYRFTDKIAAKMVVKNLFQEQTAPIGRLVSTSNDGFSRQGTQGLFSRLFYVSCDVNF
jgi:outer membrane cobalamin receptor